MKHRLLWLVGASGLLLLAILIWLRHATGVVNQGSRKTADVPGRLDPLQAKRPQAGDTGAASTRDAGTDGRPASRDAMLAAIKDASVTYDAKALPIIEAYLLHADPLIRAAAKNGMIVLGDAAAGPLLREASHHVATPHEATALLEAADYVELPSASVTLKKGVPRKTPAPPPAIRKRLPAPNPPPE